MNTKNKDYKNMPGHWVLASLGKKVLRPGGLQMTRQMLTDLNIGEQDEVVEFAPGLGLTAQITLQEESSSVYCNRTE